MMDIKKEIERAEKEMNWAGQLEAIDKEEIKKLNKHIVMAQRRDKVKVMLDTINKKLEDINKEIRTGKAEMRGFLPKLEKKRDKAQRLLNELNSRVKILEEQVMTLREKREEIKRNIAVKD
ncbi:hypothetical protein KY345_00140 [Candidatus Woesearchaeota archaeon]|nr:hypothetical protein [Candidatus Woesearchaeota archaeon]